MSGFKKFMLWAGGFVLLFVFGLLFFSSVLFIGKKSARSIALSDAGLSEAETVGMRSKLEYDDGLFVYDVSFYCDGIEYEYKIDAIEADILEMDVEGAGRVPTGANGGISSSSGQGQGAAVGGVSRHTSEEAETVATTDAGFRGRDDVGILSLNTTADDDDGRQTYDVEFLTAMEKYEYKINRWDLSIVKKEKEYFAVRSELARPAEGEEVTALTNRQAKRMALMQAGLEESDVGRVRAVSDLEDGVRIFEVTIYDGSTTYEYEISRIGGRILKERIEYNYIP